MNAPLRTLTIILSLVMLSPLANANWSVSDHITIKPVQAASNQQKLRSHFVQIFSSINATKAEGMKNTLEMQGYRAFVKVKQKIPKTHYQVQIGPFVTRRLAEDAKMRIIQLYPQFPFLNEAILKLSF